MQNSVIEKESWHEVTIYQYKTFQMTKVFMVQVIKLWNNRFHGGCFTLIIHNLSTFSIELLQLQLGSFHES